MTIDAFENEEWYTSAKKYWETVSPDVDGMLGGFSHLDPLDITASERFLESVFATNGKPAVNAVEPTRACDMGAGIGRISKHLLLRKFDEVDLVESNMNFLNNAASYIGEPSAGRRGKLGKLINLGLEEVELPTGRYHVIWCQWVLSHLTDDHLITFLEKCLNAVRPNGGYVILKENVSRVDEYIIDNEDSSVTRSASKWRELLKDVSGDIVAEEVQPNFPQQLFPVHMWALR